jgi:hypothetical protein
VTTMNRSVGYRLVIAGVAIAAGAAAGAFVFKAVGEQQIGSQVEVLTAKFGVRSRPGDTSTLDLVEKIAPGTRSGFESAIIGTVIASVLAATVVTIAIREVAQ